MLEKILKKISLWLPVIIWAFIIFNLSNQRLSAVSPEYWKDFAFKKGAHIFFYSILSVLFYRALSGEGLKRKSSAYGAVFLSFLYGTSDEIHQSFIPGRESTLRDIVIDTIGASISAFLLYYLLPKLPNKVQNLLAKLDFK